MNEQFHRFAVYVSSLTEKSIAFIIAFSLVIGWAVTGPLFGFSETWQLFINTTTTIITFLMTFLIQHTQGTMNTAMHKKLDEVIRALPEADDDYRGIEHESCE